ncbi:MAG: ABC transporter ATP-binding protein, partial [Acidimicrobiaceae bacterium]|nr:ABC transporter ATP-binding protein [Acidimicrobiaceae bacterium]
GKNGAGKSTLLYILAGLTKADSGEIQINGSPPSQDQAWLSQVGFVDQEVSLPTGLSVKKLSKLGRDLNSTWNEEMLLQRSDQLEIPLDRHVNRLSGGQKQVVAVLMALAKEPSVLLFDEPLASLDPINRRALLGILLSHAYDSAATILLSSHLIGDLERACDHIVLLSKGSVALSQATEELLATHFWATNSKENRNLINRLVDSPSEYLIEMDTRLLICSANESLRYQLDSKPAGLEEIVIARMTGKRVFPEAIKARG